jgi:hypothetical protein
MQDKHTHPKLWRRIVSAAIVAAGIGVIWGVAVGWLASTIASLGQGERIYEQLTVAYDGTPVISSQTYNVGTTLDRRTLDGKPWPADYELWLGAANPGRFELPPGVIRFPIRWQEAGARVAGMTDGKKPPTAWYIVSTDADSKYAYFVGYEPLSNRSIGYIGTVGFRLTPPPTEEQFSCANTNPASVIRRVTSTQYLEPRQLVRYHNLSPYDRPAQWLAYLTDGERLWEVNLRDRTSRAVLVVPKAISLSKLTTLEETIREEAIEDSGESEEDSARDLLRRSPYRFIALQDAFITRDLQITGKFLPNVEPPKTANILVIRTPEQLVLYDTTSDRQWTFKLPGEVSPDRHLSAYWITPDTMLLNCSAGYWSGGNVQELYWISPDGEIQKQERVKLQGYVRPPESQMYWAFAAMMPEPLGWAGMLYGVVPFFHLQNYKATTYAGALQQVFWVAWPMALIVVALSAAAAWYASRLHRHYYRTRGGIWIAFVFLFGIPGLIAYWLEHRRARLDTCSECGATVPRDRDACAACETPFAAPGLVGTEVFA